MKDKAPERPEAEWLRVKTIAHNFKCSHCMSFVNVPTAMKIPLYKYCPFCGAKMKEVPYENYV